MNHNLQVITCKLALQTFLVSYFCSTSSYTQAILLRVVFTYKVP